MNMPLLAFSNLWGVAGSGTLEAQALDFSLSGHLNKEAALLQPISLSVSTSRVAHLLQPVFFSSFQGQREVAVCRRLLSEPL